jgi:replicative DNA helicase
MNINYCTETERDVLAGLITNSNQLIRNKKILHSDLFHAPEHSSIYEEITRQLDEERRVSPDSMRNKFDQLGWTDRKGNKISDLIAAICVSPPEADEISELIVQLVELDYQRKGKTACTKIQNILDENLSLPEKFDQIQRTFAEGMRIPVSQGEKPTKIWEGYIEQKEYDAAHPEEKEIIGYDWPYPTVTDIYGKLRRGCVHVIVSRGGVGKSTMVSHVSKHLLDKHGLPTLILDTEMDKLTVQDRMFASLSGVGVHPLEENKWFKSDETKRKFYEGSKKINPDEKIYHIYVGGKSIEEIEALALDFYYTEVGSGNPFLMVYDYVKCDVGALKNNWAEHQALGDHMDRLHQLARTLNCVVLTAAQANRGADSFSSKKSAAGIADDSTAIADSDRIQRYAEFVAILRTKTYDDVALDEPNVESADADTAEIRSISNPSDLQFGTHMFTVIKSRHGGAKSAGHLDFVERVGANGKRTHSRNYVNLSFDNFEVVDKGDLRDIVRSQSEDHDLSDGLL